MGVQLPGEQNWASSESEILRMRISRGGGKAICTQVLKVTSEKAHSHHNQEQSKEQQTEIDIGTTDVGPLQDAEASVREMLEAPE